MAGAYGILVSIKVPNDASSLLILPITRKTPFEIAITRTTSPPASAVSTTAIRNWLGPIQAPIAAQFPA